MGESDFSGSIAGFRKQINNETSGDYIRYIASLQPRYWRVWFDIMLGFTGLAATLLFVAKFRDVASVPAIIVGAFFSGIFIHYLLLFQHEAAHFGLARKKQNSDLICNVFLSWQVGTSATRYRASHLEHHKYLGKPGDTEISYRNALNLRFLVRGITLVLAIKAFFTQSEGANKSAVKQEGTHKLLIVAIGGTLQATVVGILFLTGGWQTALSYCIGFFIFFPFFGALRQLLEHRSDRLNEGHDPSEGFTRLFDDAVLPSIFGTAGFNRHLLHHWEPTVSYTNLAELETYLLGTSARSIIHARRSTYWNAFRSIWKQDSKGGRSDR